MNQKGDYEIEPDGPDTALSLCETEREPVAEAGRDEQRFPMSYEAFLAWSDEDTHAEWVNGEVIVFMPPVTIHQLIAGFLASLIGMYANLFNLGTLLAAPFEMRLLSVRSSREPDLLFVAQENLHRLKPERLEGPADLVIEIVSPSSATRDTREKLADYETAGVREYWIIDPRPAKRQARFYQRTPDGGNDGVYHEVRPDSEGQYHSLVLAGFWLCPAWLWQEPLPDVDRVLAEVCGEQYLLRFVERQKGLSETLAFHIIEKMLDAKGEAYARRLLEYLGQRGFLPGEKKHPEQME